MYVQEHKFALVIIWQQFPISRHLVWKDDTSFSIFNSFPFDLLQRNIQSWLVLTKTKCSYNWRGHPASNCQQSTHKPPSNLNSDSILLPIMITNLLPCGNYGRISKKMHMISLQIWCIVGRKKTKSVPLTFPPCIMLEISDMVYDQGKWVWCRRHCFRDIGKERGQILLFYIVFSSSQVFITDKLLITL